LTINLIESSTKVLPELGLPLICTWINWLIERLLDRCH